MKMVTAETLRNLIKGTNENAKTIMKIFQQHSHELKSLIGKDFSPAKSVGESGRVRVDTISAVV